MSWQTRAQHLATTGLYDPETEHDACGVGLVAAIDGQPRREVVEKAIEALKRVYHRGAVDADGKTGDGAGIHLAIPQAFFNDYLARIGRENGERSLAVGMVFLPRKNLTAQEECRAIVEAEILRLGFTILAWRQVPVAADVIGDIAADSRPEVEQVLIHAPIGYAQSRFERELFITRKRIERAVRARAINNFYICSLSCRSLVYKGLFKAEQLTEFYPDLLDARFTSPYALFHQRFSTNTAPAWHLAQPFRVLAHNGEINTVRGNKNFMRSHEATFSCALFKGFEDDLTPVIPDNTSDTGALDSVMEILSRAGRPLPLAKLILIPPAWSMVEDLPPQHREMFSFCNTVSEPWDGPAAIAACDGEWVVAGMDRSGLRPMRYTITHDGLLAIGSESGMVPVDEENVAERGRLGPGEILGVHLPEGKLYKDTALKDHLAAMHPYANWGENIVPLTSLPLPTTSHQPLTTPLRSTQLAVGLTQEEIDAIILPMALTAKEALGSMGDDTPLAVLSDQYRPFHHFFRQNFSQVTNPPIDPLRERRVMSLFTRFGNDGNFLALDGSHSETLLCETPILLATEMAAIEQHYAHKITRLSTLFPLKSTLAMRLAALVAEAEAAVVGGTPFLLLSDEGMDANHAPIPMILAISAVHSHLVKRKLRKRAALMIRTAECHEPHAAAVMIGSGATVIHPYMAEATVSSAPLKGVSAAQGLDNYREAMGGGLLKIMSKMGISVISSYRGGLNFEAIGLSRALAAEYFPGLPSRISGIGLTGIESRVRAQHVLAFTCAEDGRHPTSDIRLPIGGFYRYRARMESHAWSGPLIHLLQTACTTGSYSQYKQFSDGIAALPPTQMRDLMAFATARPAIPVETVEPVSEIRKRFVAPAMSLGALSPEAHETLAIAMNRIGANSNSGEGGEGAERYRPYENGDNANSGIKQVASGRFGVTAEYLNAAQEIQIKVAQGAKPGEGGQLPAFKVTMEIARLRHATPGVSLISPPPHHDIYSIEDLAQLIYDLKQINPRAQVSVKLVAQAGIGTIASGVAKAMADKIVIAGHNGGTGASPWSSVKYAGIPWEMGLAEANQVLTLNRLRHRVRLQTDGGLKTGRDIIIAAMLGAEEYALGTAALVAMGCLMVRQCHANTCPVGLTTQDPALREKFEGTVDKVINLVTFVAEEVREHLARLGYTKLDDIIGRADLLTQVNRGGDDLVDLDLNTLLALADPGPHPRICPANHRNAVADTLDETMLSDATAALSEGRHIQLAYSVQNTMRSIGTRLSSEVTRHGAALKDNAITLRLRGSAGQSLGAFLAKGITIELYGDANDYVGKGLSGGNIIVRARPVSSLIPHDNTIIGNTVLYGATSGTLFANGQAGERFAVRNSGALTVVEGCGACGCEYMTGGAAVILGEIGHNFAAGMTGGMAYVYDPANLLEARLNTESVLKLRLASAHWEAELKKLIEQHVAATDSPRGRDILTNWQYESPHFWQICPREMLDKLPYPLQESDDTRQQRGRHA